MIKILFKFIVVVLLLLFLIPLFKLLIQIITPVFVGIGIYKAGVIDPWGVLAFFFLGLTLFFVVLIIKD